MSSGLYQDSCHSHCLSFLFLNSYRHDLRPLFYFETVMLQNHFLCMIWVSVRAKLEMLLPQTNLALLPRCSSVTCPCPSPWLCLAPAPCQASLPEGPALSPQLLEPPLLPLCPPTGLQPRKHPAPARPHLSPCPVQAAVTPGHSIPGPLLAVCITEFAAFVCGKARA